MREPSGSRGGCRATVRTAVERRGSPPLRRTPLTPSPYAHHTPSPALISSTPLATSVPGAEAWHIRYRSHDQRGREHEVTGIVFAPRDRGTDAPIVTWCHGATGIGDVACPSAQPDPAPELTVYFSPDATTQIDYGVPGIAGLIEDGYVVFAADYQGLGTPGIHQYNVNRTTALDALYAAHAAREMGIGAGM